VRVKACACIAGVFQFLWFTKYSVVEKSVHENSPIVLKRKEEKKFPVAHKHAQTDSLPSWSPCPFHLPFLSFSDVAEARSYVAALYCKRRNWI
jgi:hypothetical protein